MPLRRYVSLWSQRLKGLKVSSGFWCKMKIIPGEYPLSCAYSRDATTTISTKSVANDFATPREMLVILRFLLHWGITLFQLHEYSDWRTWPGEQDKICPFVNLQGCGVKPVDRTTFPFFSCFFSCFHVEQFFYKYIKFWRPYKEKFLCIMEWRGERNSTV